jgi:vitamin B12 transporter
VVFIDRAVFSRCMPDVIPRSFGRDRFAPILKILTFTTTLLLAGFAVSAWSQQVPSRAPAISQSIVVLGVAQPVRQSDSSRSTYEVDVPLERFAVPGWFSLLREDSSVDLQERGGGAVQSDVSIRGSTFEQTLVLLNGLRMDDPETSHFNLDLPIPLGAIAGIDVLHGAGSTLYGADALGGVINMRTSTPTVTGLRLSSGAGSYGINTQAAELSGLGRRWSVLAAGSRDFSSGFMDDRDYRSEAVSVEPRLQNRLGLTDVLLAGSDRAFGANQFYGNYPSFEHTKAWFAGLTQQLGARTEASGDYRRHTDEYVLVRDDPALYENNHIDESWEAVVRRRDALWHRPDGSSLNLYMGLEEDADAIQSNNLGQHARNRGAGYARLDAYLGQRATAAVGVREEILSGGTRVFSPSASAAVRLKGGVKVRGAAGYGFRLPTFTDLYYSDPTSIGNARLLPEWAWSFEGGADWYARPNLVLRVTGFGAPQHHTIDYTRLGNSGPYTATNLGRFTFSGTEVGLDWRPTAADSLHAGWTWVTGAQYVLNGLQSRYVFNYAVQNADAEWLHTWRPGVVARVRLGVTQRYESDPYTVADLAIACGQGWWQPYLQLSNATNAGYAEIAGVRMQGRAITGGVSLVWPSRP